jgi:predicted  nucleic acid-binding Zn-ribbon protein
MEASAVEVRLRNHDQRIDANHNSLSRLRDTSASHTTEITVMKTELRETREDISDIRKEVKESREEQREEMRWVRRGLWAAAGTFLLFFVASASLLVSLSGHG